MAETESYPTIDPTNFDLIVVGSGVPESVIGAAASSAGKSVLQLDPNPFYGSHFASHSISDLISFLQSQCKGNCSSALPSGSDFTLLHLTSRPRYFDVEISSYSEDLLEQSRKFNLDLAGPRVMLCADSAVELMVKSGASQYMEFKSIDESLICGGDGKLWNVPDSRKAIFKDRTLGFAEKNQLMRFYKMVQGHLETVGSTGGESESAESTRIAEEDLESPFVDFLSKMGLPPKIKSYTSNRPNLSLVIHANPCRIIMYAIAMADYDQEPMETCKDTLKTKDGINRLALYNSSVGRFPNTLGAFIYPLYGQGELPQSYCRRAAVKGCLHVLRMSVIALLMDKDNGSYKGIKLVSGQELFSHQLVLDPSFAFPLPQKNSSLVSSSDVKRKVARGIYITRRSLKPNVSNCLVFYPPRSLYPEQVTSIRVLQLSSNCAVCPSGMFVNYLSSLCDDAAEGKKSIGAAVEVLFSIPVSGKSEKPLADQNENPEEAKPVILWSASYIQELAWGVHGSISITPMPDGDLIYNNLLNETVKLFHKMYPDEELFPVTASSDTLDDDGGLDPES